MRTVFFVLLLANLLFLGWAEWIAVPASRADPLAGVTRLQLVSRHDQPEAPGSAAVPARAGALSAALAAQSAASPSAAQPAGSADLQCLSIGPFRRGHDATEAASLLRAAHFAPRQRIAAVQPVEWYWVYVPDVSGNAQIQRTLNGLQRDGIHGAEPMPMTDGKPGISLGLFRDPALARRRLTFARAKGFSARMSRRLVAQPAYWLDMWAAGGSSALPLQALHARLGTTVGTRPCPPADRPPLPGNATGAVAPGVPLPADQATATPSP